MTDRELLEKAAKAAGLTETYPYWVDRVASYMDPLHKCSAFADEPKGWGTNWNPLEDDGDALRLAVKLGLLQTVDLHECLQGESDWRDPCAATRRAIVRAAAAIGEGM